MNFNFGGLGQTLSNFGQKMGSSLSNGLSKVKDTFGSTTGNMNNLTFTTPKPNLDSLTFGDLSSPNLNTEVFSGKVIQQPDLNPDVFRGSVIQQIDLDNPSKLTLKDRWNNIPQEKKTAFAQAMSENIPQYQEQQAVPINYIPQDYSWVFQPTRGSMFYGN